MIVVFKWSGCTNLISCRWNLVGFLTITLVMDRKLALDGLTIAHGNQKFNG